jgi:hypothetical protein
MGQPAARSTVGRSSLLERSEPLGSRLRVVAVAPARAPRRPIGPRLLAGGAILASLLALGLALGSFTAQTRAALGRDRIRPAVVSGPAGQVRARVGSLPGTVSATLPFAPDRADRAPRPGEVPSLYADGLACSTGCRPPGAQLGWPLAPFHAQHPLRAGLNELRPGSLHVGVDIQARDGAAVYAVAQGMAEVLEAGGPNARVRVGHYVYWHILPSVLSGQWVTPFVTKLGTVMPGYGHIAFSELGWRDEYVNPLRPRGSVLIPYANVDPPAIGAPAVAAGGQVIVSAYSPQSFVRRTTYTTPVLAPAGLAYRLFSRDGAPLTPLQWAFRGTHLLAFTQRALIYAPGARAPGYGCFARRSVCVPNWTYRVAGGLAPPLPYGLAPGRYRLTIYAWDWADNATALDTTLTLTASGWRPLGHFPAALYRGPDYFTQVTPAAALVPGASAPAPAAAGNASANREAPAQCCASSASSSPSASLTP